MTDKDLQARTEAAESAPENPLDQRVFVNRNLRMVGIQAVGFDLDHTLAHYNGPEVEELAYRLARDRLVESFGYPEHLRGIGYDREFVQRGLVLDKRRGNILKMDYHNYVTRAYHGTRLLLPEERKAAYRTGRVRVKSGSYVSLDTLFHLPEAYLFVVLVGIFDRSTPKAKSTFGSTYADVRKAIDSIHGDGSLKREILADRARFLRRDPHLVPTLEGLRAAGKKLFLLTNSEFYYSSALLEYLTEDQGPEDWRDLFDVLVVDAGKPRYFTELDRRPKPGPDDPPSPVPLFHGGNARQLEAVLQARGDQIVYFGDHTYGDILRSKKTLGWRTAMVVEELEHELQVMAATRNQRHDLDELGRLRTALEADWFALEHALEVAGRDGDGGEAGVVSRIRTDLAALDAELGRVHEEMRRLGERLNRAFNAHWGPIFRDGGGTSSFGHQVRDFACVYMTRVSNLRHYSPHHYYRSEADRLPHEQADQRL